MALARSQIGHGSTALIQAELIDSVLPFKVLTMFSLRACLTFA
jgi:hypothetical protein